MRGIKICGLDSPDVADLVTELDTYLPLDLRSKTWLKNLAAFEGVRSIETLPALLRKAKSTIPRGLLHYVSVEQKRWRCLSFLSEAFFQLQSPEKIDAFHLLHHNSPWSELLKLQSINGLSDEAARIDSSKTNSSGGLKSRLLPEPIHTELPRVDATEFQEALGEIWECLGFLILSATKLDIDESQTLMQCIHVILAEMHSLNIISSSIYQHDSDLVPRPRRKPPFLHAMSSRILTVLSDSVWRANEREIIEYSGLTAATYASKGREMPGAELNPKIRPLLPGTWLEFVLWSCVHGGHFIEASRLISTITSQAQGQAWSLVGWEELKRIAADKLSAKGQRLTHSWLDKIAGAFEGYSEEPSVVEMPKDSISSEVVAATLEGLFNDLSQPMLPGNCVKETLCAYRRSLPKQMSAYQQLFWNTLMFRFLDSYAALVALNSEFGSLPAYGALKILNPEPDPSEPNPYRPLAEDFVESLHDPFHGILIHCLDEYVFKEDLNGSLITFRHLQAWTDSNKARAIQSFSSKVEELENESFGSKLHLPDDIHLQISDSTKAAFLDLVVNAKIFGLAKWLLYSDDIDQPLIPSYASSSSVYQPVLLRYALALSDYPLLIRITRELNTNLEVLSPEILRALLTCQISLGKWHNAGDLLEYMRDERNLHPTPKDIIAMACKLLRIEFQQRTGERVHGMTEIQTLLRISLGRGFLPPRDPSRAPNYTPVRELNQLSRILSTVDSRLATLSRPFCVERGPASAPIVIPVDAFNALLAEVVHGQGPAAARKLFNRWCNLPTPTFGVPSQSEKDPAVLPIEHIQEIVHGEDRVVTPNVESVRIVLANATEQLAEFIKDEYAARLKSGAPEARLLKWSDEKPTEFTTGESHLPSHAPYKELLEWGVRTYRRIGLDDAAIYDEMPGAIPDPRS